MKKKIRSAALIFLFSCSLAMTFGSAKAEGPAGRQEEETEYTGLQTAMDREDLNLVFAVDHSGSMNVQDAGRLIPQVLQSFVDTMHGENIRIGYVAYNDTIVAQRAPVLVQEEGSREELKQTMAGTPNQGETDIGLGLREAYHMMDGCVGRKMIVILSDGETDLTHSNTGRTEADSEKDIENIIELCCAEGTPVVTVVFGRSYEGEEAALKQISDRTGGECYEADIPEELVTILYGLFHTDFSYFVREVCNSVYDGGEQRISCTTDEDTYDEQTVLFFSDQEIKEVGITCGWSEVEPRIRGQYAVASVQGSGEDVAVRFETGKGQRMRVFLIGRRIITPVIRFNGELYKNRETAFEIFFLDVEGRRLTDSAQYVDFDWQAAFRGAMDSRLVSVRLEKAGTGLLGHATFDKAGKYRFCLWSDRNSGITYEIQEIEVLNTLPENLVSAPIVMTVWEEEQMFDLDDFFTDADGDTLSFLVEDLPEEAVSASVEGHYLHVTPQKRGGGDIILTVTDGEGSIRGLLPVRVRSLPEAYPAVPIFVIVVFLFGVIKICRKRKKVTEVTAVSEEKNLVYFTGKLNAYFTVIPQDMDEIPPLTFTLHPIREGRIRVGDMFRNYPELSSLLELERMSLYPAKDRKIIFYHDSRATVMIGSSIVCRKMQYAVGYGSVIYITSQDGSCELELHYISTV